MDFCRLIGALCVLYNDDLYKGSLSFSLSLLILLRWVILWVYNIHLDLVKIVPWR